MSELKRSAEAMMILLTFLAVVIAYRVARSKPSAEARKKEDVSARIIAVLSLIAMPLVAFVVISYGMNMAMSAGGSSSAYEIAVRVLLFAPATLGCIALARAHNRVTLALSLPSIVIYFIPALQKNLGL